MKFALFLLIFKSQVFASLWTPAREDKPTVKLGIVGPSFSMSISDPKDKNKETINYSPNIMGSFMLGVEYLGYSGSIGYTSQSDPQSVAQYGKTKGIDYQFRIFRGANTLDFFYQKYQGFYIQNSREIDPNIQKSDPFFQYPSLHTEHLGFQYFRTLNPDNLSMSACFEQSGWQNQSGGSWLLMAAMDQHHIDSDLSLIPAAMSTTYAGIEEFRGGDFITAKLGLGGAFALVYKGLFLAGKLLYSFGQQKQKYLIGSERLERSVPTQGGNIKLSFGYNGDPFFTAIGLFIDTTQLAVSNYSVQMGTVEVRLHFGLHF